MAKRLPSKLHQGKRHQKNWWTAWAGLGLLVVISLVLAVVQHSHTQPAPSTQTPKKTLNATDTQASKVTYGIALGKTLSTANPTQTAEILGRIKQAGFSEVRLSLDWTNTESKQGTYDWARNDMFMKATKKAGLRVVALVDRAPAWTRGQNCNDTACPPSNPEDYAKFTAAAASRYKNYDIAAWEVWNEENGSNFWKPLPDARVYGKLLQVTYPAIKQADPGATVLVGGLSGDAVDKLGAKLIDPRTFLTSLYVEGYGDYFDGVAYHPYIAGGGLPNKQSDYNGWLKMNRTSPSIRSIMVDNGDSKKGVWISEFGTATGGKGAEITDPASVPKGADHSSMEAQKQIVTAAVDDLKTMPWIRNFDWYTYRDSPTAPSFEGAAYGILQADGTPKPALAVLQAAMKK